MLNEVQRYLEGNSVGALSLPLFAAELDILHSVSRMKTKFDNFDLEIIIIALFTLPFLPLYIVIENGYVCVFQKNGVCYSIVSTLITVKVKLGK